MRLLVLLVALQSQPSARATQADSAAARAALRAGLIAFDSVSWETAPQHVVKRYMEQLLVWNMKEEGGEAVLRFDRASTLAWRATSVYAAYWLWLMLDAGDTLSSERFIATLPYAVKDIHMKMAGQLLLSDVNGPRFRNTLPRVLWLESRISKPSQRADVMARRAQFLLRSDSTTGRVLLRQAIQLSQSDTTEMWYTWKWMIALLKLGDQVPVDDIVRAARYAQGDLWSARRAVADELIEQGLPHLARPYTAAAGRERPEVLHRPEARMAMHFLRATSRDSSLAWAIQDSLDVAAAARMSFPPEPTAVERAARSAAGERALARLEAVEAMSRTLLGWRPRFNSP
jgi:hypothetical protein